MTPKQWIILCKFMYFLLELTMKTINLDKEAFTDIVILRGTLRKEIEDGN